MWQPWATLAVAAHPLTSLPSKQYETRAFRPRFPLPIDVVIHATKKWDRSLAAICAEQPFYAALHSCGYSFKPLPRGVLIGVARIVEVFPAEDIELLLCRGNQELAFGDYSPGRYAWRLDSVKELSAPIAFQGRQDVLYRLDDYYEELIAKQLGQFSNG
jgi:activating signal cointegrator 1